MLRVLKVLDSHVDHVLKGLVEVVADPGLEGEVIRKKLMPVMATILIDIFSGIASLAESYWGESGQI